MNDDRIIKLFGTYLSGGLSADEKRELDAWLAKSPKNLDFFQRFSQDTSFRKRWDARQSIDVQTAFKKFEKTCGARQRSVVYKKGFFWSVAAVVVLTLSLAVGLLWNSTTQKEAELAEAEILPGTSKALLFLETGKCIALEKSDTIQVESGGARISNFPDRLVYSKKETAKQAKLQYNELHVPKGGEYSLELSDGTLVRLNANSTLKYPTVFAKDCRKIEFSGEAFFHVAKSNIPFKVKLGEMEVEVYGTSFNINTNIRSKIQTALVEGKVGIVLKNSNKKHILSPSEMAELDLNSGEVSVREVNLDYYLAWTKGLFVFNNETLEHIMETLGLWYDFDIFFTSQRLQELHFTGLVKRYDNIDVILDAIADGTRVKFRQKGKTLTVYE